MVRQFGCGQCRVLGFQRETGVTSQAGFDLTLVFLGLDTARAVAESPVGRQPLEALVEQVVLDGAQGGEVFGLESVPKFRTFGQYTGV